MPLPFFEKIFLMIKSKFFFIYIFWKPWSYTYFKIISFIFQIPLIINTVNSFHSRQLIQKITKSQIFEINTPYLFWCHQLCGLTLLLVNLPLYSFSITLCYCGGSIALPVRYFYASILPDNNAGIFATSLLMSSCNF